MTKKTKTILFIFIVVDVLLIVACFGQIINPSLHFGNFVVLNPQGVIAQKERALIITATLIMLTVVIPVFILLFFIAWKYKAGRSESAYSPEMQSNKMVGTILWGIPIVIISIIGVMNWKSTHELDPYKNIASNKKTITIQVVALQWKWLFIYPEQNIATVNFIEFPENTPVSFELTAEAPMNSFWIPQLGGQMYAMAGMETHLHLMANQTGEYAGSAAEISGAGFAGMRFVAKSVPNADFDAWVKTVKSSQNVLSLEAYNKLAQPSEKTPVTLYSSVENNLFNTVMMKFMAPEKPFEATTATTSVQAMPGMQGMDMTSSSTMSMPGMDMK